MEKVALMPGIAAYVYTKSGNLSSYGRCNACGGVEKVEGGSGFALPAAALQLLGLFAGRQPVSIGWEEPEALQAANGALGSKFSEILIRGSNGLNFYRGRRGRTLS